MLLDVATALGKVRKALASRHLFDNWPSLMIKYALLRLGFDVKLIAKIRGCTFEMGPETFERFVSRSSRGLIKSVTCVDGRILVNGVEVKNLDDVIYSMETWARVLGWAYDPIKRCWFKGNVKFRRMYGTILGVFDYSEYKSLSVKDRVVVDVGAFVGDSAIYFALRGARKVIAIEPHPEAYREMLENITLNKLEDVIVPINAGLASRHGRIRIERVDVERTAITYHRPGKCDGEIMALCLGELISKYSIDSNAVLKMDCQGCEYDIVLNDYAHVKLFDEIILEYHADVGGKPAKLLKVLSRDYRCKIVEKRGNFGMIYCVRKW
jgi:FkbM family methyltransferase